MIKISVIMPVYNAESYLKKNLDYFSQINNEEIELIIVNDGSIDNSENIIKSYTIKNLVYIYQENKGVSSARNVGISKATGLYVTFLDSDDSLQKDFFEYLLGKINYDYDIIRYGLYHEYPHKMIEKKVAKEDEVYKSASTDENLLYMLFCSNNLNTACNQLIKLSLIKDNNIEFLENHKYAEDYEFNRELFLKSDKVLLSSKSLYNYYMNNDSTCRNENLDNVMKCINDAIEVHTRTIDYCEKYCPQIIDLCCAHITLELKTVLKRLFFVRNLTLKETNKIIKCFSKHSDVNKFRNKVTKADFFIKNCLINDCSINKVFLYKHYYRFKRFLKRIVNYFK